MHGTLLVSRPTSRIVLKGQGPISILRRLQSWFICQTENALLSLDRSPVSCTRWIRTGKAKSYGRSAPGKAAVLAESRGDPQRMRKTSTLPFRVYSSEETGKGVRNAVAACWLWNFGMESKCGAPK